MRSHSHEVTSPWRHISTHCLSIHIIFQCYEASNCLQAYYNPNREWKWDWTGSQDTKAAHCSTCHCHPFYRAPLWNEFLCFSSDVSSAARVSQQWCQRTPCVHLWDTSGLLGVLSWSALQHGWTSWHTGLVLVEGWKGIGELNLTCVSTLVSLQFIYDLDSVFEIYVQHRTSLPVIINDICLYFFKQPFRRSVPNIHNPSHHFFYLFSLISRLLDVQQTSLFSIHRFMNPLYELALFSCLQSCCLWEEKPASSHLSNAHKHLVPAGA